MKLKFFIIIILFSLFLAKPGISDKSCSAAEVNFEGGALTCPTCLVQEITTNYQDNPKHSKEVNSHMQKALDNDLDSAKWLINYFSQKKTKNQSEVKKWFGRALSLGANGEELRLLYGYDERYMTTAYFSCGKSNIFISASCLEVNKDWKPLCYDQRLHIENDSNKSDFFVFYPQFRELHMLITSIECYVSDDENWLITESVVSAPAKKTKYKRKDYFKNGEYQGSNLKDPLVMISDYKTMPPQQVEEIKNNLLSFPNCSVFKVRPYPAIAK